jgi:hypothetical protein
MALFAEGQQIDLAAEQLAMDELQLRLSNSGSQQDVIAQLRALNLVDDFWMFCFKVSTED